MDSVLIDAEHVLKVVESTIQYIEQSLADLETKNKEFKKKTADDHIERINKMNMLVRLFTTGSPSKISETSILYGCGQCDSLGFMCDSCREYSFRAAFKLEQIRKLKRLAQFAKNSVKCGQSMILINENELW